MRPSEASASTSPPGTLVLEAFAPPGDHTFTAMMFVPTLIALFNAFPLYDRYVRGSLHELSSPIVPDCPTLMPLMYVTSATLTSPSASRRFSLSWNGDTSILLRNQPVALFLVYP